MDYLDPGIPQVQGNSPLIPTTTAIGNCSDPSSFKVAIVDSGFQANHPDSPCVPDGNGGYINCMGNNFGHNDPWDKPVNEAHGTHVQGTMSAVGGNGLGIVGMIPDGNGICWMTARVFDDLGNGAYWSTIFAGVSWAVSNGAKVINMSLGGPYSTTGYNFFRDNANKDVSFVAAAGNCRCSDYSYPASFTGVVSVAAVRPNKYVFTSSPTRFLESSALSLYHTYAYTHTTVFVYLIANGHFSPTLTTG